MSEELELYCPECGKRVVKAGSADYGHGKKAQLFRCTDSNTCGRRTTRPLDKDKKKIDPVFLIETTG